ncbi:MAG: hypothetical protein WCS97_03255 [Candidatus Paceibacterota bacterium]|jgi:uncharacterized protein HemX
MKKTTKKGNTAMKVGAGLAAAAAAAAAGYYFYGSKSAKKHRKAVEKWAKDIDPADLKRAVNELKTNWEMVRRETGRTVRKSVAKAKSTAKRV